MSLEYKEIKIGKIVHNGLPKTSAYYCKSTKVFTGTILIPVSADYTAHVDVNILLAPKDTADYKYLGTNYIQTMLQVSNSMYDKLYALALQQQQAETAA